MRAHIRIAVCGFLLHRLWGRSPAVSGRVVTSFAALFHLVESGSTVLERIWCCTASPQHQGNWSGLWTWVWYTAGQKWGTLWQASWYAATLMIPDIYPDPGTYIPREIKAIKFGTQI